MEIHDRASENVYTMWVLPCTCEVEGYVHPSRLSRLSRRPQYLSRVETFIAFSREIFPESIQGGRLRELAEKFQPPRRHPENLRSPLVLLDRHALPRVVLLMYVPSTDCSAASRRW